MDLRKLEVRCCQSWPDSSTCMRKVHERAENSCTPHLKSCEEFRGGCARVQKCRYERCSRQLLFPEFQQSEVERMKTLEISIHCPHTKELFSYSSVRIHALQR